MDSVGRRCRALYLIKILGGAFATSIVPVMLVVSGDAAATAHNIQTHELFRVVNRRLALLDACFILVAIDGLVYLVYSFADFLAPGLQGSLSPGSSCL